MLHNTNTDEESAKKLAAYLKNLAMFDNLC